MKPTKSRPSGKRPPRPRPDTATTAALAALARTAVYGPKMTTDLYEDWKAALAEVRGSHLPPEAEGVRRHLLSLLAVPADFSDRHLGALLAYFEMCHGCAAGAAARRTPGEAIDMIARDVKGVLDAARQQAIDAAAEKPAAPGQDSRVARLEVRGEGGLADVFLDGKWVRLKNNLRSAQLCFLRHLLRAHGEERTRKQLDDMERATACSDHPAEYRWDRAREALPRRIKNLIGRGRLGYCLKPAAWRGVER
jgi:hypothetical protein